jgi:hypothetical protein
MTDEIITDEAIEDFIGEPVGEPDNYHPILEVWRAVLEPARGQRDVKVTPAWANRVIGSYAGVTYADMNNFRDAYFGMVIQMADVLEFEISTDDECLNNFTPEDDLEHNVHHYKNLLRDWQMVLMQRELDWDCESPNAAVEMAVLSEVHKMFFGDTGLTQFLDNIQLQIDETDQAMIRNALDELKAGHSE